MELVGGVVLAFLALGAERVFEFEVSRRDPSFLWRVK
jgi:hypothetical protein